MWVGFLQKYNGMTKNCISTVKMTSPNSNLNVLRQERFSKVENQGDDGEENYSSRKVR
jgi:hypothetical protein